MSQTINGKVYEDQDMVCQDCKAPFIFTAGEQAFFDDKGFTPPKRCKPCRVFNRAEKDKQRAERSMPDGPDESRTGRRSKRDRGRDRD